MCSDVNTNAVLALTVIISYRNFTFLRISVVPHNANASLNFVLKGFANVSNATINISDSCWVAVIVYYCWLSFLFVSFSFFFFCLYIPVKLDMLP